MERIIIGIAGGTASGKTTLADVLLSESGKGNAVIIRLDNYYRHRIDLTFEKRAAINHVHPDAFDVTLVMLSLVLVDNHTCMNNWIMLKLLEL